MKLPSAKHSLEKAIVRYLCLSKIHADSVYNISKVLSTSESSVIIDNNNFKLYAGRNIARSQVSQSVVFLKQKGYVTVKIQPSAKGSRRNKKIIALTPKGFLKGHYHHDLPFRWLLPISASIFPRSISVFLDVFIREFGSEIVDKMSEHLIAEMVRQLKFDEMGNIDSGVDSFPFLNIAGEALESTKLLSSNLRLSINDIVERVYFDSEVMDALGMDPKELAGSKRTFELLGIKLPKRISNLASNDEAKRSDKFAASIEYL